MIDRLAAGGHSDVISMTNLGLFSIKMSEKKRMVRSAPSEKVFYFSLIASSITVT